MKQKKIALITGITGMDGSHLAEFLLEKGYEVHGIVRRTSTVKRERIEDIYQNLDTKHENLFLHYGDLTDSCSVQKIISEVRPDEIYNLAAMSHVGISFDIPEYTANCDGLGLLRILEALRKLKMMDTRVYQASTSELFGKVQEIPQTENTPFYPRSPYGVAKLYAYWIAKNYREAYNMYVCNGILYNHESIPKNSPVMLKDKNEKIDIFPIEDLIKPDHGRQLLSEYVGKHIWNGKEWTKILGGSFYRDKNKKMKLVQTTDSCYEATFDHVAFTENDKEIKTQDWTVKDKVFQTTYPQQIKKLNSNEKLAYFIGFVVGDGTVSSDGKIRICGTEKHELEKVAEILENEFGWSYFMKNSGPGQYPGCKKDIWRISFHNERSFGKWLKSEIYTKNSNEKKVPKFILNANKKVQKAFFDGYYLADGRQNGHEKYHYKGFTTKSATLALGLIYLFQRFSKQVPKVSCTYRDGQRYYYAKFRTPNEVGGKGEHKKKPLNEIIKTEDTISEDGYFYDIQTESQTFATGPNLFKIHNSPRRGENFVTRKITLAVANHYESDETLKLGNLDAKRDWGYAPEYVEAMWLMLQQKEPDDYVLATGETHTVREFVEAAFEAIGITLEWKGDGLEEKGYADGDVAVEIDPRYYRPAEVELLLGDATKAKKKLKWEPKTKFKELVKLMVESDIDLLSKKS
jgi:GDPmannose 4,6-dehydratase